MPDSVFSHYMYKTLPRFNALWSFKKHFTMQLALASSVSFLMSIKSWSLHDMLFSRQTGSIIWTRFNPNYDASDETEAWRLGVLVRVCALALVVGQLLTERALLSSLDALVTLIALAVTVSVLDRTPRTLGSAWHGPVEGAVTAGVVLLVGHGVEPLLVVLGVPVVLAGLRRGFLAAVLTWAGAMSAGAMIIHHRR